MLLFLELLHNTTSSLDVSPIMVLNSIGGPFQMRLNSTKDTHSPHRHDRVVDMIVIHSQVGISATIIFPV